MITQLGIIGLDITPKIAAMVSDLRRPAGVLVAASSPGRPYDDSGLKSADVIFFGEPESYQFSGRASGRTGSYKAG